MKKVSIIMPVYNTEKYIAQSIESVLNQTYQNIELIIIDDKSTDNSFRIAREFAKRYNCIKLIENNRNYLVGHTRNIEIEMATGEYIAFIDSDDMYTPNYIEKLVSALEEHSVLIAMCKHRQFIGKRCLSKDNSSGKVEVIDIAKRPSILNKARGCCWNKMYHRSIFDKLRFPTGIIFEDVSFSYAALISAQQIAFIDSELYHYRRNLTGITMTNKRIPQKGILDLYYASAELEKNYKLVKKDNQLDKIMRDIMHSILYISVLDSSCWLQLPHKDYVRIVNLFAFLANRKYGLTVDTNDYMGNAKREQIIYFLRLKFVEFALDKDFFSAKSDEENLLETEQIIDSYLTKNSVKVKKK